MVVRLSWTLDLSSGELFGLDCRMAMSCRTLDDRLRKVVCCSVTSPVLCVPLTDSRFIASGFGDLLMMILLCYVLTLQVAIGE